MSAAQAIGWPSIGAAVAPDRWLPPGKRAAVCFTIDDVHPGRSDEHYDGGGDLADGVLGLVSRLLARHPDLKVTLFTTPDWREISPAPSKLLSRIPVVRDYLYLTKTLPSGTRRLSRHPRFAAFIRGMPRTEVAVHGLHHIHRGRLVHVEFQKESSRQCAAKLERALAMFREAQIPVVKGLCPPGWNAPPGLLMALRDLGFKYVASARDIRTEIGSDAVTNMSGLQGASLIHPTWMGKGLVHFASNFQATSSIDRARAILDHGGILAVKGHAIKNALGHVALDGIDELYCNYLDVLFSEVSRQYGDSIWWTTMGEIADRVRLAASG